MPANRNALIRYKTIDLCLQNRFRKWTLENLIESVSEALYEYEGIYGVSKRTIQGDIQMMRSDKLGYNAPIIVVDKKYYSYEDTEYSITNMPLSENDLSQLAEAASFLKQFEGFSHFQELSGVIQKLEDHIYTKTTKEAPIIHFEKNENLKGLSHLDPLYQAIKNKIPLEISYQPFKAKSSNTFLFFGYLLKEFNNRWFLVGQKKDTTSIMTLALDRIVSVKTNPTKKYIKNGAFNPHTYYEHVIGVTLSSTSLKKVRIFVNKTNAPYVLTKPLHHSQEILDKTKEGIIIQITVLPNFELERLILGFGESMEVLGPSRLRNRIKNKLKKAAESYL